MSDLYTPRRDQAVEQFGKPCKPVKHYKQILDDQSIDGVLIGTPDHWHVPLVLEAIAAGKDVYCEKPITQNIAEGEKLIAGVEASNQVVQTGTQQRSWDHYIHAKDIIQSGALGQITFVECYWYQNYRVSQKIEKFDTSKLDWDLWLGTRKKQPFDPMKYRRWRFFWDFGGGIFTDLLTHWIDAIQWIMDSPAPHTRPGHGYDPFSRLGGDARHGRWHDDLSEEFHGDVSQLDDRVARRRRHCLSRRQSDAEADAGWIRTLPGRQHQARNYASARSANPSTT